MGINMDVIYSRPLETAFVKKDFIKNFGTDYEDYLTEFINKSKFVKDNNNNKFTKIKKQSHSECDITNGYYLLDYKLLTEEETIENMSQYKNNIEKDKNGAICESKSKKEGKWIGYIFHNILKDKKKEDFERIEFEEYKKLDVYEKKIKKYLKNIKKDKNILYFIPYELSFGETALDKERIIHMGDVLTEYLKGFFEYRNSIINNKDTYISFINKGSIVFFKYIDKLELYDIISTKESKLFSEIEKIYW